MLQIPFHGKRHIVLLKVDNSFKAGSSLQPNSAQGPPAGLPPETPMPSCGHPSLDTACPFAYPLAAAFDNDGLIRCLLFLTQQIVKLGRRTWEPAMDRGVNPVC